MLTATLDIWTLTQFLKSFLLVWLLEIAIKAIIIIKDLEKKIEFWENFGWIYLFNSISTSCGLFNAKIQFSKPITMIVLL